MGILDIINAEMKKVKKGGVGLDTTSLKDGKNIIRVLPNPKDMENGVISHKWGQHFIKGLEPNDKGGYVKAVVPCNRSTYDEDCPICNAIGQGILNAVSDKQVKTLFDSKAGKRYLINALNRSAWSENKKDPVIMEIPKSVLKGIIEGFSMIMEQDETANPLSLTHGIDFSIKKTGIGLNTDYTVTVLPISKPVSKEVMQKVIDLETEVAKQFDDPDTNTIAIQAIAKVAGMDKNLLRSELINKKPRINKKSLEEKQQKNTESFLSESEPEMGNTDCVESKIGEVENINEELLTSELEDLLADL